MLPSRKILPTLAAALLTFSVVRAAAPTDSWTLHLSATPGLVERMGVPSDSLARVMVAAAVTPDLFASLSVEEQARKIGEVVKTEAEKAIENAARPPRGEPLPALIARGQELDDLNRVARLVPDLSPSLIQARKQAHAKFLDAASPQKIKWDGEGDHEGDPSVAEREDMGAPRSSGLAKPQPSEDERKDSVAPRLPLNLSKPTTKLGIAAAVAAVLAVVHVPPAVIVLLGIVAFIAGASASRAASRGPLYGVPEAMTDAGGMTAERLAAERRAAAVKDAKYRNKISHVSWAVLAMTLDGQGKSSEQLRREFVERLQLQLASSDADSQPFLLRLADAFERADGDAPDGETLRARLVALSNGVKNWAAGSAPGDLPPLEF